MSRKREITQLLEARPRTTAEIAQALGLKVSTATVHVAELKALGVIKPVGEQPNARRQKPVTVWGSV